MNIEKLIHRIKYYRWKDAKRDLKHFWQRRTRGFDDKVTYSLDYSLAKLIAPRLKRFAEVTIAYPPDMEERDWAGTLDKMVAAFEFAASEKRWDANPEEYKKHQEGIDLFAKYFFGLWW